MNETQSLEAALTRLLAPSLNKDGYLLAQIKLTSGGKYVIVQVMAERSDAKPMTVHDCVAISRIATAELESRGVPQETYTLEVTTPEHDRPLVRHEDFERFAGRFAVIDLQAPMEGRQRFSGKIVRVTGRDRDAELEVATSTGSVRVPVRRIAEARLSSGPESPLTEEKTKNP